MGRELGYFLGHKNSNHGWERFFKISSYFLKNWFWKKNESGGGFSDIKWNIKGISITKKKELGQHPAYAKT